MLKSQGRQSDRCVLGIGDAAQPCCEGKHYLKGCCVPAGVTWRGKEHFEGDVSLGVEVKAGDRHAKGVLGPGQPLWRHISLDGHVVRLRPSHVQLPSIRR